MEKMVSSLCLESKKNGFNPSIFIFDEPEEKPILAPPLLAAGIPLHFYRKSYRFSFKTIVDLIKIVFLSKARYLHTHDLSSLIYGSLAKIILFSKIKIIHTQHSLIHLGQKRRYLYYEKIFSLFVDSICTLTPEMKKAFLKSNRRVPINVISNGVDFPEKPFTQVEKKIKKLEIYSKYNMQNIYTLDDTQKINIINKPSLILSEQKFIDIRSESSIKGLHLNEAQVSEKNAENKDFSLNKKTLNLEKIDSNRLWIINVARLSPEKGQDFLLQIWSQLPSALKQKFQLIFVGGESIPGYFQTLISKLSQGDSKENNIVFAGPFANPIDWYVAADLYISASKIEGNPLGPMEALSNCTPLLLSKIEGHTIFADNALLFMADNLHNATEDLKLKLNEILLDLPVVDEKKWSFAKTQWSTNCMFKKYSELYI